MTQFLNLHFLRRTDFPFEKEWASIKNDKLAFALIVINFHLSKMPNGEQYSCEWKKELRSLFSHSPKVPYFFESTGFLSKENFEQIFSYTDRD